MDLLQSILAHPWFTPMALTAVIILVFPLLAGYIVLVERKVLADMQVRLGPMRVGPHGLLQPIADAVKLLLKEDIIPAESDKALFWIAPIISTFTALTAFCVIPFASGLYVADVNVGLLVISAVSSVGILGIVLGGWSSNSHYALLGALRGAAQLVSYEVALALALLSGVMCAGTLSMTGIVRAQQERGIWFLFDNYGLMVIPFVVYVISAVAETNRAPFDMPEAESELVAGFHTEYSGFRWALYFLAEYANIFVVSSVAVTLFLGGWLRPFPNVAWLEVPFNYGFPFLLLLAVGVGCLRLVRKLTWRPHALGMAAVGALVLGLAGLILIPAVNQAVAAPFWFLFKVSAFIYLMIWFRGTFPRFRYDQLMNIGWKIMIPVALGAIMLNAVVGMSRIS